jgi:hypothetical protein
MNKLVGSGHPAGGDGATDGYGAKSRFHRSGPTWPILAGRVAGCAKQALGQDLVAQTTINQRPDHLLCIEIMREAEFDPT